MRKLPVVTGVFVAAALVVAACGGSSTPTVPAVNRPSLPAVNLPSSLPTLPPINLPSSLPSFQIPSSFALPSFAIPSFNGDPDLAAKFPKTIGGATVSTPETALYADLFAFGGNTESAQQFAAAMTSIGVNPATVSYGTASVDLNESDHIQAIRTPGYSGSQFLAALPQISQILSPQNGLPTISTTTIGGKTVTVATDADEITTYYYPSGDIVWTTDATDPSDLAAIFGAIQ
jgi:hypothetical protein